MESALTLIDALIEDHDDERLPQLRELVANPSLDDLESIIEGIASDPKRKVLLVKRGSKLIKKIMGKK